MGSQLSRRGAIILDGLLGPILSAAPVITGIGQTGQTLSVGTGSWATTPVGYTYRWRRSGTAISGATNSTYTLAVADEERLITCTVTAIGAAGGATSAASANTIASLAAISNAAGKVVVGKPLAYKPTYARNVWDMNVIGGMLYVGYGNSANTGPSPNSGPIPAIRFDGNTFQYTYTFDDEQIDRYKIIDGQLWMPRHDPNGGTPGFYRLDSAPDGWTLRSGMNTINPQGAALHAYDVVKVGSTIYAGAGNGYVYRSTNDGVSWAVCLNSTTGHGGLFFRMYSLFILAGVVWCYAESSVGFPYHLLYRLNTSTGLFDEVSSSIAGATTVDKINTSFPAHGGTATDYFKYHRHEVVGSNLLFILGDIVFDHQSKPRGLYKTADPLNASTKISLTTGHIPFDIYDTDTECFILTCQFIATNNWTIRVMRANDRSLLTTWIEEFSFSATSFARSFIRFGTDWYFGLGSHGDAVHTDTGQIIRYRP